MMLFDLLVYITLGIFTVSILLILIGAMIQHRLYIKRRDIQFTLIIPAKDESEHIERCLNAIAQQNYDLKCVEVMLMDDQSNDDTSAKAETFITKIPNLSILSVESHESLVGKANAVDQGIKNSSNDIILICDADCAPNPEWFAMMISQFDENVGVVGGITLLDESLVNEKLFGIMQNIDWTFLLGTGAGAIGAGFPISCIGSNLAFRKQAYYEVGGYEKLPFSITEDLSLFRSIARKTAWKFKAPINPGSVNWSIPMKTLVAFYRQRKRWLFGSFDLNLTGGIMLAAALLIHILPFVHILIYPDSTMSLFVLIMVFSVDLLTISSFLIMMKQYRYILFIPIYFVYYIINVLVLPFVMMLDHRVVWKGRLYSKKGMVKSNTE